VSFQVDVPVRFGDVDYARIVYYPRLFHLLHVSFEELFARHVGIPYHVLIEEHNLGFPAARIETDFKRPFRFGEVLAVTIDVPRIGNTSADFVHTLRAASETEIRAVASFTRVAVDMQTLRPVPIPEPVRVRLRELAPTD
jgi:4-hydroxybenzoyl-CoA thioesterase